MRKKRVMMNMERGGRRIKSRDRMGRNRMAMMKRKRRMGWTSKMVDMKKKRWKSSKKKNKRMMTIITTTKIMNHDDDDVETSHWRNQTLGYRGGAASM